MIFGFGKKQNTGDKLIAAKPDEDFIPYVCHYDPHTIITKNGELLQTIRITGFGTDSVAVDILSLRDTLRDSIVAHVKDTEFAFWFHTFRRKKNVIPKGEFPDKFSSHINETWDKENNWSERYVNELYITIITEGLDTSIGNMKAFFRSFSYATTKNLHQKHLQEAHKKLSKVVTSILVDIEEYGANLLGIADYQGVLYSEPMRFFGKIINLYEERYPLWFNDIAADLASHKFAFGDRNLEVVGYDNKNFASILSLKEYQESSVESLDRILQLPFEFIISQSFDFNFEPKELEHYQYQDYLFKVSGDEEARHFSGVAHFTDGDVNSPTNYGKIQTTIMIISKSKDDLEKDVKFAMEKFSSLGLVVVREDVFAEHCFWSQLPGNFRYLRRQKIINSYRVGGFTALHNFPSGKMSDNHWGSAVTVLRTVLDTPYFFNFHEGDLGHTLVVGPKSSGKTVLVNFLLAQSRKFKNKIFYFDLNQSSSPFIKALDGKYYKTSAEKDSPDFMALNPMLMPKNDESKLFLTEWFKSLLAFVKDHPPQEQIDLIPQVVDKIFAGNVSDFFDAISLFNTLETRSVHDRLKIWGRDGKLSHIFGSTSELNWSDNIIGFDMSALIDQKPILIAVFNYLLRRIEDNLDGSPAILVLDEALNLIDNPVFMPQISLIMERLRQKNCVIIFVTSDFDALNASDIFFEIKRNISNEIYSANQEPHACYKTVLELTENELEVIRIMDHEDKHFVFKHRHDAVVASLSLRRNYEILKMLAADEITVAAMEEVIEAVKQEIGEVPTAEVWVPQMYEILQQIRRDLEEQRRQALIAAVQEERKHKEQLEAGVL